MCAEIDSWVRAHAARTVAGATATSALAQQHRRGGPPEVGAAIAAPATPTFPSQLYHPTSRPSLSRLAFLSLGGAPTD